MDIPLLVRVSFGGVSEAGEIDTEVYCVNLSSKPFQISVRSASFTTVDEEVGTVVEHGSAPAQMILLPGEAKMVSEVAGWEWDGYVGIELKLRESDASFGLRLSYDLKRSAGEFAIESLGKKGYIVHPSHTSRI